MKCLRCATELARLSYGDVTIDRCPKCRGTWLDDHELGTIVRGKGPHPGDLVRSTLVAAHAGIPPAERRAVLQCLKCGTAMKLVNYAYSSGIMIDTCPVGHGVWLDGDELERAKAFEQQCETG